MKLESQWEDITPAKAMKYLETMVGNRFVRQWRIDYYAATMKAGLWRPTHQGIAFDSEGHLVDGQHRMWAVIESGATIRIMVTQGLSPEDVAALDITMARTYADTAHYQDWQENGHAAALCGSLAKMMVMGPNAPSRFSAPPVIHGWYEFYKDAIDLALKCRWASVIGGKAIQLPMTLAFARASYTINPEVLFRFMEVFRSGQLTVDKDRAAVTLRDGWMQDRLGTAAERFSKTEAAIKAFADRRPIKKLYVHDTTDTGGVYASSIFEIPKLPRELQFKAVEHKQASKERKAFEKSRKEGVVA